MGIETAFPTALFGVLNAAKGDLGLVGVYDIAPQPRDGGAAAAFPYAVIGEVYAVQYDTQTTVGFQITNRIHVFSRSGSKAECLDIQGGIFALLHRTPMTITGFNHTLQLREDTRCDADEDSKTHGVCDYFGLVEVA
jgi:hypothetical protein